MDREPDPEPVFILGTRGFGDLRYDAGIAMTMTMTMTIGVGALIGVALGLRFKVLVLIPTIVLAAVSTAVIQAARGYQASSIIVTIVLVATTLQIGYLVGIIAHAAIEKLVPLEGNDLALNILGHMEVVGSDGRHVGTVDHTESSDRIILTGDDPKAAGRPHLISTEWVDYVDSKVHLNRPSRKALREWRLAA
jgi:hypothetical protein